MTKLSSQNCSEVSLCHWWKSSVIFLPSQAHIATEVSLSRWFDGLNIDWIGLLIKFIRRCSLRLRCENNANNVLVCRWGGGSRHLGPALLPARWQGSPPAVRVCLRSSAERTKAMPQLHKSLNSFAYWGLCVYIGPTAQRQLLCSGHVFVCLLVSRSYDYRSCDGSDIWKWLIKLLLNVLTNQKK